MLYILLPTLVTVGLIAWAFDEWGNDDDASKKSGDNNDANGSNPAGNANTGQIDNITTKLDVATGRTVVSMTNGNDSYTGTDANEQYFARPGDDIIFAGKGNDALNMGAGNDTAAAGEGNDRIFGGAGNDLMNGGKGNDFIAGGAGNDIVASKAGFDALSEVTGKDEWAALKPGMGKTFLQHSEVSDAGDDFVHGGSGDDLIIDTQGSNRLFGDTGNDTIVGLDAKGTDAPDRLWGGKGDDILIGDDGDKMWGGEGKDMFYISVMEKNDEPVAIQDYEAGEKIQVQIDLPDGSTATPTYSLKDGVVTMKVNGQDVATIKSATALTTNDLDAIKTNVVMQIT